VKLNEIKIEILDEIFMVGSQGGKGETPVLRSTSGLREVRWSTGVPESRHFPLV